ncbi:MAG: TIGR03435 family protein [Candidatus Solibacter sp.]
MKRGALCAAWVVIASCLGVAQHATIQPTFEVAFVRVAAPQSDGQPVRMNCVGGPGSSDPIRLTCTNAPLKMLMCIAYQVQYYQVTGPGWMDTDGYDIAAKIPSGTSADQYRRMLQNLLSERFQVALHHDVKNLPTYSLEVAKSGSKVRRSAAGASAQSGMSADPGIAVNTSGRFVRVTAHAQPLSKLAGFLSTLLGVGAPVVDKTGLTGDFDFDLQFTPETALSSDADGISLVAALDSQLGLRLAVTRNPVDILVVDHAAKAPTEN